MAIRASHVRMACTAAWWSTDPPPRSPQVGVYTAVISVIWVVSIRIATATTKNCFFWRGTGTIAPQMMFLRGTCVPRARGMRYVRLPYHSYSLAPRQPANNGLQPGPDSLLINGVGQFDCSMAVPSRPVDCIDQQLNTSFLDLNPAITYRIRVVNTGYVVPSLVELQHVRLTKTSALTGLTLTFDREHLNLIQLDGVDVEHSPQEASNSVGILFPGQRMDFILHPSKVSIGSALMVEVDEQCVPTMVPLIQSR